VFKSIELVFIITITFIGFYGVFFSENLIKKLLMLGVLNASTIGIFLYVGSFYSTTPPILSGTQKLFHYTEYADPLPQALVLTAVVIGFATQSLSLVYVMYVSRYFHTLEEEKIERVVENERISDLDA